MRIAVHYAFLLLINQYDDIIRYGKRNQDLGNIPVDIMRNFKDRIWQRLEPKSKKSK
jgi:hypothetical protein